MSEAWSEHLAWAKDRALDFLDAGDAPQAVASFTSDIGKHEEGQHIALERVNEGTLLLLETGGAERVSKLRAWIVGFN